MYAKITAFGVLYSLGAIASSYSRYKSVSETISIFRFSHIVNTVSSSQLFAGLLAGLSQTVSSFSGVLILSYEYCIIFVIILVTKSKYNSASSWFWSNHSSSRKLLKTIFYIYLYGEWYTITFGLGCGGRLFWRYCGEFRDSIFTARCCVSIKKSILNIYIFWLLGGGTCGVVGPIFGEQPTDPNCLITPTQSVQVEAQILQLNYLSWIYFCVFASTPNYNCSTS